MSVLNQVIGVWAALREVSASEAAKASRKVRRNSYRIKSAMLDGLTGQRLFQP
ncbi:MAG: hypothetical protein RKP46_00735 [Candidatus Accumulibacter sp.]|uniref:hypothetical protein n=1 Tax=Accumulibacter sp. TaxID=2053492 RepID=UPI002878893E|nr:hypothetical protein [Accumulibacter sp.]MDS4012863.1 hypothetical protein [Accumulibacter sp.]